MKQVFRRVIDRTGKVTVVELPEPHVGPTQILIQTHFTLISSGTESSTLSKTPTELVKQTLSDPWMRNAVKGTLLSAGPSQTGRRVWNELLLPRPIGYSGAGRVLSLGSEVEGFNVGDKIAFAAHGHAELAAPHINHVAAVPESVDLRHAAFVTVGAIALHSIRRAELQIGEVVVIFGLGLVGQLCAQIAKAAGCVVIGVEVNQDRNDVAFAAGIDRVVNPAREDLVRRIMDLTGKRGVDATIICASSKSNEIINLSTEITRKQGRIVLVGYVGLDIHPKNFLYQELDIRYSRAYGPGSYDNSYEKGRVSYPFGYVRWTEQRNLEEVIRLIASGALKVEPLIDEVYPLARVQEAFDKINGGAMRSVAALIQFDTASVDRRHAIAVTPRTSTSGGKVGVCLVGVGNHALATHLPNLKANPRVNVRALVSATGKNASMVAADAGAVLTTSDLSEALADPAVHAVVICSSQLEHAAQIVSAVRGGKAVYVEKPTATTFADYARVVRCVESEGVPIPFALGVNRRYSPLVRKLREFIADTAVAVDYTIAQPFTPLTHWTLDPIEGAGRLISEGEHFIDICNLLIGRKPLSVYAAPLGPKPDDPRTLCNFAVTLRYDAAVANVTFSESSARGYPRERVTVFGSGRVATLDDFAKLTLRSKSVQREGIALNRQMGHLQALDAFIDHVAGSSASAFAWEDAKAATLAMFGAQESIRTGEVVDLRQLEASIWESDA
jgi:predicted dehydrogenase/threonine dehydrogenase-like Zn-dependent dehydrogenase